MGKSKNIIAVVIVAIIGTLIFWKRDWIKEKLEVVNKTNKSNSAAASAEPSPLMPGSAYTNCDKFPLKFGCSGEKVIALQKGLNRNFNAGIGVDGDFGSETETALIDAGFGKEVELSEVVEIMK